jgi:hypothetical protein
VPSRTDFRTRRVPRVTSGLLTGHRRAVRLLVFALAVVGSLAGAWVFVMHLMGDPLADAHAYYLAGQRLNAGLPLYEQPGATIADTYVYPPLLAILFRPLALLPMPVALAIWEGVIVAALAVTLWPARRDRRLLLALGILALPVGWAVAIGQGEVVVAALLSLGTPLTVALAGHLKLFPWLAAVVWFATRDRRRVMRFVGWTLVLLAVQVVLAPAATLDYLKLGWLSPILGVRSVSPFVIHPIAYVAVVGVLAVATFRYARTPAGWPLAVALVVLAYPRLLLYQLTTLLAAFGGPARHADVTAEEPRPAVVPRVASASNGSPS